MKVVVTGGGTVAPIDDVRSITNVSSGRFSAAITEACLRRGAQVRHIHAPGALLPFHRLARFDLDSDDPTHEVDRLLSLRDEWRSLRNCLRILPLKHGTVLDYASTLERLLTEEPPDVVFLAMAVSDFEPDPVPGKIDSGQDELVIRARRTEKVIRKVRDWSPSAFLVGFKLLSNVTAAGLIHAADLAGRANRADLTVANNLRTLREGRHTVHLVRPGQPTVTLGPSANLAEELVDRVFRLTNENGPPRPKT